MAFLLALVFYKTVVTHRVTFLISFLIIANPKTNNKPLCLNIVSSEKNRVYKRGSREDMAAVASPTMHQAPMSNDQHNILIEDPDVWRS